MAMIFDAKQLDQLAVRLAANATELDAMAARVGALLVTCDRLSPALAALASVSDDHRSRSIDLALRAQWLRSLNSSVTNFAGRPMRGATALDDVQRLTAAINQAERDGATEAELGKLEGPLFRARQTVRSLSGDELVALVDGDADLSVLFSTITQHQREGLVQQRAEVLGSSSAAPLEVRVEANRYLIADTITLLEDQADKYAAEAERLKSSWWPPLIVTYPWSPLPIPGGLPFVIPYLRSPAELAADRAKGLRGEIGLLEDLLARQILVFDWSGSGRVAEWVGPLDAPDVAISIPGTGSSKLSLPSLRNRAEVIVDNAGPDVAVVSAVIYDAPDNLAQAALDRYALRGDVEIASFISGLVSTERHLVVIGHSYGSTVMGESLKNGLGQQLSPNDDVVILGSPGVHVDTASELNVAGTVWAAQVDGDEIAVTGTIHNVNCLIVDSLPLKPPGLECEYDEVYHHGVNPVHPAFGAKVFETGTIPDGDVGFLAEFGDEHSEYWAMVDGEPSEALANLIRIIQADYEAITLANP